MILSERYRTAFIHIPKCGGSSVRAALQIYHDSGAWPHNNAADHPDLGWTQFNHVPLAVLKQYFPDAFERVESFESFAISRDPLARFRSACAQRARQHLGFNIEDVSDARVRGMVDEVIAHLSRADGFPAVEFVHFTRQRDFVDLGGERIVKNVFPLERLDDFFAAISVHLEGDVRPQSRKRATYGYRSPVLRAVVPPLARATRRWMPKAAYQRVRSRVHGVVKRSYGEAGSKVFESDEVRDFASEFYAGDAELHRQALAERRAGHGA